jgi:hypothetical protein
MVIARQVSARSSISPATTAVADLDFTKDFADNILSPSPLSDSNFEALSDYYGLTSNPVSVGNPWKRPTGPEAQRVPKEARPICEHPIADVWPELGQQIYEFR